MKKYKILLVLGLTIIFNASCKKNQVTPIIPESNGTLPSKINYIYQSLGVIRTQDVSFNEASFNYDAEKRLISVTCFDSLVFKYDTQGRLYQETWYNGPQNGAISLATFVYDQQGRIIAKRDSSLKPVVGSYGFTYAYDSNNNLIADTIVSDTGHIIGGFTTYEYSNGNVIKESTYDMSNGTPVLDSVIEHSYTDHINPIKQIGQVFFFAMYTPFPWGGNSWASQCLSANQEDIKLIDMPAKYSDYSNGLLWQLQYTYPQAKETYEYIYQQ